jgi:hypothetical protein
VEVAVRRLVVILGLLTATVGVADGDLKTRLESGEVVITTRAIAGTNLPEVTAKGIFEAPPERLWAILQDCGNYKKTMQRVVRSKEISRDGAKVICETEIGLPFPLSNLVGVTESTHVLGPPAWSRTWHLLRGDYEVNEGSWTLTRYGDDAKRTLVVYRVHAIPKSAVPDAIIRRGQHTAIPDLFNHLREITKS